jgi:hypothetical protein
MPHHCPFPVRSTDSRRCYRTGSAPGFALCLALVAVLWGYAGLSHADFFLIPQGNEPTASLAMSLSMASPYMAWTGLHAGDTCCGLVDDRKTSSGEGPSSIGLSKSGAWLTFRW